MLSVADKYDQLAELAEKGPLQVSDDAKVS